MNPDDQLDAYFRAQAPQIDLPTAGRDAIVTRGRRRRHRRLTLRGAAVVGVLALGGAVVAQGSGGDGDAQDVTASGASLAESAFDWTLVEPTRAIGSAFGSATTADGAIYDLSTAPGRSLTEADFQRPAQLYRTTDGTEWTEVGLPDGLKAAALAAGGDRLYAVGTSPAGGGVQAELASSDSGGGDWDRIALPLDVAALGQGFPGHVTIGRTDVAAAGDTTLVAATVHGVVDVDAIELPDAPPEGASVSPDVEGIAVYPEVACPDAGGAPPATVAPTTAVEPDDPTDPDDPTAAADAEKRREAEAAGDACAPKEGDIVRYSWAELGFRPEVADLVAGRTELFVVDAAGTASAVDAPADGDWTADVLAGEDGFWLVQGVSGDPETTSTNATFSPDGRDWSAAPVSLPGYAQGSGLLAGTPTVALIDGTGEGLSLVSLDPTGVRTTDVTAALGRTGGTPVPAGTVAFGPLGFAAVLYEPTDADRPASTVVHSTDGTTFSVVEVPEVEAGKGTIVQGIGVSADAVTVRLSAAGDEAPTDDAPVPAPYAYVGTRR